MSTAAPSAQDQSTMDQHSVRRVFWRYAIPSIAAMLVNGVYQIADGIFIGHYIGSTGLAAIGMAWPIIYVVAGLGLMVGMGSGALISIARGAKASTEQVNQILWHAFTIIIVMGLLGALFLQLSASKLLMLQGADAATLAMAQDYVRPFIWGAPITILAAAMPILIRNDEQPKLATLFMMIGASLNIVLDYLFIGVLDLGLSGAAMATVLAQTSICVLGLMYFLRRPTSVMSGSNAPFSWSLIKKINLLGSSSLVMYLYTSFVFAIHNRLFMEFGGTITVGAFSIVGYLMVLYYLIAEGIGEGVQPPASYYHGADKQHKIKQLMALASKIVLGLGLAWMLLLNCIPELMISLFNSQDQILIASATTGIRLHLSAMLLDGFIVLATMYFMAVNQGAKALAISISNMLIQLPFLYFLPQYLGLNGVWLALPLSTVILSTVVIPLVWHDVNRKPTPRALLTRCPG
ncbi:MATE family efflux transporter [Shewanella waksmanii]|uniref:MATE family efflux transporter n=1 Tax=Shewanella waksmanii TaxID=213783 RepID=UPI003735311F